MRNTGRVLAVAILAVTVAVASGYARGKEAPTAPGTYKQWGPDIDTITIVKTLKLSDYDNVIVMPFDTSKTPMPEKSEKSYESVKSALDSYTESLVEALRDELKGKSVKQ